jgi:hypothetical protein
LTGSGLSLMPRKTRGISNRSSKPPFFSRMSSIHSYARRAVVVALEPDKVSMGAVEQRQDPDCGSEKR